MYVVGQQPQLINGQTLFGGNLTVVNLTNNTVSSSSCHQRRAARRHQPHLEADDNTLWIAMTGCTTGVRYATNPSERLWLPDHVQHFDEHGDAA